MSQAYCRVQLRRSYADASTAATQRIRLYWGCIEIMEKMETLFPFKGVYRVIEGYMLVLNWDNGKYNVDY